MPPHKDGPASSHAELLDCRGFRGRQRDTGLRTINSDLRPFDRDVKVTVQYRWRKWLRRRDGLEEDCDHHEPACFCTSYHWLCTRVNS